MVRRKPLQVRQSDVKQFLLYLADADRRASTLSGYLSAIPTAFDKMCLRNVTFGIVTPRKPKTLPSILSWKEVQRLLESTPTLEDKLILGLMYACGIRVSEVARLRFRDVDFDRRIIMIRRGKGLRDRPVILPETLRPLLASLSGCADGNDYLFPSRTRQGRYISPQTIQRKLKRAVQIAGIKKKATPHSLRHSFATHTFEDGCDIRNIQKLLGHVHLETTTIYVKVARPTDPLTLQSPLDRLGGRIPSSQQTQSTFHLSFHFQRHPAGTSDAMNVTIGIRLLRDPNSRPIYLTGTQVTQVSEGWSIFKSHLWSNGKPVC